MIHIKTANIIMFKGIDSLWDIFSKMSRVLFCDRQSRRSRMPDVKQELYRQGEIHIAHKTHIIFYVLYSICILWNFRFLIPSCLMA